MCLAILSVLVPLTFAAGGPDGPIASARLYVESPTADDSTRWLFLLNGRRCSGTLA